MNCLEFRRQADTDPNCPDPAFQQHKLQCSECASLVARVSRLQTILNGAVRFDTPENLSSRILLKQSFSDVSSRVSRRKTLALAASVVVAVGAGVYGSILLARQSELAREVFALIRAAPYAVKPKTPLATDTIAKALAPAGLKVSQDIRGVTFAGLCLLKNRIAGHLVFQGSVAPVTVFVIPGIRIESTESIRSDALRGILVPYGSGTLAIVGAPKENLDAVREQVGSVIEFRSA